MMNESGFMKTSLYLIFVVLFSFCGSSSFGADGSLHAKIDEICKSASASNQVGRATIEKQLLRLVDENADPQSRGLVYKAIANIYSGDLMHHAEDTVRYAREALTNQLSVLDACDMYVCLAEATEAQTHNGQSTNASVLEKQVVPLIQGLSFVLDHLRTDKRLPPSPVWKYDVDPTDPRYEKVVRRHAEQVEIRNDVLQQNRLLVYRDDFSERVQHLYGSSSIKGPVFARIVREAVGNADKAEKVLLQLDAWIKIQGESQ